LLRPCMLFMLYGLPTTYSYWISKDSNLCTSSTTRPNSYCGKLVCPNGTCFWCIITYNSYHSATNVCFIASDNDGLISCSCNCSSSINFYVCPNGTCFWCIITHNSYHPATSVCFIASDNDGLISCSCNCSSSINFYTDDSTWWICDRTFCFNDGCSASTATFHCCSDIRSSTPNSTSVTSIAFI
uniref:CUB domain-containing protein n=1 Tax=Haemonchus placei TaxID=6290 RepID=A0A158QLE6_HAEPC